MCFPAIMSGEESCKGCPGYTTCPNSTVWEEDWTEEDLAWIENADSRRQEEEDELYETWLSEYSYSRVQ